ncbi:hypothetical protein POTOM_051782 [Populus tomentosa]|uniref:Uncharacterized protein n=1 Tax=Populus tomentosa TaxID=118781 RepID=A0A8X7Y2P4_POPTO|nr:hypothetical protein POTOM_051782 [Populus tomentosa]
MKAKYCKSCKCSIIHASLVIELLILCRMTNFRWAYDLVEHRYAACKLDGLNVQWSEDKKPSYIRHALREYNIHKTLVHNQIAHLVI